MNGYFIRQHKGISIFFTFILIIINFSKLIQMSPTESRTGADRLDQRCNQPKNNLLSYTREQLVQIRQQVMHGNLLGLPSGSITNIQRHKIYKRKPRIKNKISSRIQQHGINFRNIHQIKHTTKMQENMLKT